MKYRKKPVVVEAFKFDGDFKTRTGEHYVPLWAEAALHEGIICFCWWSSYYDSRDIFRLFK